MRQLMADRLQLLVRDGGRHRRFGTWRRGVAEGAWRLAVLLHRRAEAPSPAPPDAGSSPASVVTQP
jgi:hypothetical protein